MGERRTVVALGLIVGLVLADSSVVILALPDILDHFDVSIDSVAWVLTLFNLGLAAVHPVAGRGRGARRLPVAAVPAGRRLLGGPARVCSGLAGLRAGAGLHLAVGVARRPGRGWRPRRLPGARAALDRGRLREACGGLLGGGRRAGCGGRTGRGRGADRGDQLAGDLLRAGAAGAGGAGADPPRLHEAGPGDGTGRPARAGGERLAGAAFVGADGGAVPGGAAADQRLGPHAAGRRGGGHGDALGGVCHLPAAPGRRAVGPDPGDLRRDPDRRRAGRPGAAAGRGVGLAGGAAGGDRGPLRAVAGR